MELEEKLVKSAVCGLFCPSCSLYIATNNDKTRMKRYSEQFNRPEEELTCNGCRSEKRSFYCKTCELYKCAENKGVLFCGECSDYPCSQIKDFQGKMPHRLELFENLEKIKDSGYEKWFNEMEGYYACSKCGTTNPVYDFSCRQCGTKPSNKFTELHADKIMEFLKNR